MKLDLPDQDIEFILQTLQTQPLPYVRTAPILDRIIGQIREAQTAPVAPVAAVEPAKE